MSAPIEITPYNAAWPAQFDAERRVLETVLAPWLTGNIEHIGSTAVPQLAAKPLIDIMAPVQTLEAAQPAIDVARSVGYHYYPYKADVMLWFCKPSPDIRTHHLHLVVSGSAHWNSTLAFRDALRRDAALAAEYAALKLRLAEKYRDDREAYTDGKTSFVNRVLSTFDLPG